MKKVEQTSLSPLPPASLVAVPLFQKGVELRPLFDLAMKVETPRNLELLAIRVASRNAVRITIQRLVAEFRTPLAIERRRESMKAGDSSKDDQH